MRHVILPALLFGSTIAVGQECKVLHDSTDVFSNERFVEVSGPNNGPYPHYSFLAEHKRFHIRWTWAVPQTHHAAALVGDPLYLKLTNGRVLRTYVSDNTASIPLYDDTQPRTAIISFDVEVNRADVEVLSQQWVARMRMHFTTGGTQDLDTRSMSVWPMDLAHTAKCFLQQLEEVVERAPNDR